MCRRRHFPAPVKLGHYPDERCRGAVSAMEDEQKLWGTELGEGFEQEDYDLAT